MATYGSGLGPHLRPDAEVAAMALCPPGGRVEGRLLSAHRAAVPLAGRPAGCQARCRRQESCRSAALARRSGRRSQNSLSLRAFVLARIGGYWNTLVRLVRPLLVVSVAV